MTGTAWGLHPQKGGPHGDRMRGTACPLIPHRCGPCGTARWWYAVPLPSCPSRPNCLRCSPMPVRPLGGPFDLDVRRRHRPVPPAQRDFFCKVRILAGHISTLAPVSGLRDATWALLFAGAIRESTTPGAGDSRPTGFRLQTGGQTNVNSRRIRRWHPSKR
jgi:hypothetical protein